MMGMRPSKRFAAIAPTTSRSNWPIYVSHRNWLLTAKHFAAVTASSDVCKTERLPLNVIYRVGQKQEVFES